MNKIERIKEYRALSGATLREAKAVIEGGWMPGDPVETCLLITAPVFWVSVEISESYFQIRQQHGYEIEFCPVVGAKQCFADNNNGYLVEVVGRYFQVSPQMGTLKVQNR